MKVFKNVFEESAKFAIITNDNSLLSSINNYLQCIMILNLQTPLYIHHKKNSGRLSTVHTMLMYHVSPKLLQRCHKKQRLFYVCVGNMS